MTLKVAILSEDNITVITVVQNALIMGAKRASL